MKTCPNCKTEKETTEFYNRRNKKGNSPYCKSCTNTQSIIRQQKLKIEAVEYKGGSCISCNYNKYPGALEFHHLDPEKKDFSIGQMKCRSLNSIKDELDKCILLCSNCHKEIHGGYLKYENETITEITPETLEWNFSVSNKHEIIKKDLNLILQRYKNKETSKDISNDYNVTPTYLLKLLSEEDIKISDIPEQHDVIHPKKIQWPTIEEMTKLVFEKPTSQLAKELRVSDVAIGKFCKKHNIPKPNRGYWAKLESEKV